MVRRHLINFNLDEIEKRNCDVVIVGTGIGGLYTALNLNEKYRIFLLTKDKISENNSNLAQGGIAACMGKEDDLKLHIEDTLKAGSYYNDRDAVKILVEEASENIENLIQIGTKFDRDIKGNLMVTKEGGHSRRRVLHSKDQTGKEIMRSLIEEVIKRDNIEIIEDSFAIDILTDGDKSIEILMEYGGVRYALIAKAVVLATGGIGQVYENTTNSAVATGDGIAMAYRAGVKLRDMEFIQFHPTAFYSKEDRKRFLISEAVRGEGAVLKNSKGDAFMKKYHSLSDLAPRDIVAKAILTEMERENTPKVYLDITHRNEGFIKNRFPYIYHECLSRGVDMTREYIPVCPVQHYIMGGIKTDYNGRTNIHGLYACGEAASLGVHGANRLASNSLLEAIVFGKRVAKDINKNVILQNISDLKFKSGEDIREIKDDFKEIKARINKVMGKYVFIFRNENGLNKALRILKKIGEDAHKSRKESRGYYECINMLTVAYLIVDSALKRQESLGSHIMVDSLEVDCFD